MEMERVIEFPHAHMDLRPRKRPRLGWDVASQALKDANEESKSVTIDRNLDVEREQRYASESLHTIPVSSDDEVLLKARKEVRNEKVQFVWAHFSELNSYFKKQAEDMEKLNARLAEMISLLTCNKSTGRKGIKYSVTSELKDILTRLDARVRSVHSNLPTNAMLIIFTGHGDTAVVHSYNVSTSTLRVMLEEFQRGNEICEEVFNYKIAARPDRRRQFEKELTSAIEIALNILSACLNIIELKEQVGAFLLNVLEAFASWLRLRHRCGFLFFALQIWLSYFLISYCK
ncbi:Small RNA degrading nuclease 5 [Camellia lanceoleosa]|uniref:Small RNA degrading nuclease 5 n=1 Tax=Camellia lanceoleosa TaxID=1840588 RepID=A0ACC0FYS1_9ERIC|nr:Small RNA degrading nuclease 5 [Camellia lanceoleosa]